MTSAVAVDPNASTSVRRRQAPDATGWSSRYPTKKLPSGGYDLGGHTTYVFAVEDGKAVAFWEQSTSATQFADDIHTLLSKD